MLPTTAASTDEGVIAFMNAAFGLRLAAFFAAGFFAAAFFAAGFFAADFFAAGFLAAPFLAAGFFAAVFFAAFFAVAMCLLPVGYSGRATPQRSEAGPPVQARRSIGGDYTAFSQWRNGCNGEISRGCNGRVVPRDRASGGLESIE